MTEFSLLDWKRKIFEIYSKVRNEDNPEFSWNKWVYNRKNLFENHAESPIASYQNKKNIIKFYPYNHMFSFYPKVVRLSEKKLISLNLGSDGTIKIFPAYKTKGLKKVLKKELIIYRIHGYAGGLLLPFTDLGTRKGGEHYEGGRYIIDTVKGADLGSNKNKIKIDFNYSYNPSCAYNTKWICPLINNENNLNILINAGEKKPILNNVIKFK